MANHNGFGWSNLKGQVKGAVADKASDFSNTFDKFRRAYVAAGSASSAVSTAASTLVNPVFWIVIAVILALFLVVTGSISATQVIGRNNNADGCIGMEGSTATTFSGGGPDSTELERMNSTGSWLMSNSFDFLGGQPMTKAQAAAIVGNKMAESHLTFSIAQLKGANSKGQLNRADNDTVDKWTREGTAIRDDRGLGIVQWTWNPGRAGDLIALARSMNKQWYEPDVQLAMIKNELDGGYYGKLLLAKGFNDPTKSAEDLAVIFHDVYERSADKGMEKRRAGATTFMENFTGSGVKTGGSCVMAAASQMDTSSVVGLAVSLSKESTKASKVPPGNSGEAYSKPEYLAAKAQAEQQTGVVDRRRLYADCNRFVATVVALTMDPDYIKVGGRGGWPDTASSYQYLSNSPKWQAYHDPSQAQPGDVWITNRKGHVALYVGDVNGVDSIAHASYLDFTPGIQSRNFMRPNFKDGMGRQYTGFRYIGGAPAA